MSGELLDAAYAKVKQANELIIVSDNVTFGVAALTDGVRSLHVCLHNPSPNCRCCSTTTGKPHHNTPLINIILSSQNIPAAVVEVVD